jgi:hypothetical protein
MLLEKRKKNEHHSMLGTPVCETVIIFADVSCGLYTNVMILKVCVLQKGIFGGSMLFY